jgi:hypothetical protein
MNVRVIITSALVVGDFYGSKAALYDPAHLCPLSESAPPFQKRCDAL